MASLTTGEDTAEPPLLSDYMSGSLEKGDENEFGFVFTDTDGTEKEIFYDRIEVFFDDLIRPEILNNLTFGFITQQILKAEKMLDELKNNPDVKNWAFLNSKSKSNLKQKAIINQIQNQFIPALKSRQAELELWEQSEKRERNKEKRKKNKTRKKKKKERNKTRRKEEKNIIKIQAIARGRNVRSPPPSPTPEQDFEQLLHKTRYDLRDYKNMKGGFQHIHIPSVFEQRIEEKTMKIMQNYENIHDLIYLLRGSMNSASKEIFDKHERQFETLIQNEEGKEEPDYRLLNELVLHHSRFVAGAVVLHEFYEQNAMGRLHKYLDIYSFANSFILAKKYPPKRLRGGRKRKTRKKRKRYTKASKSKKRKNKKKKRRR